MDTEKLEEAEIADVTILQREREREDKRTQLEQKQTLYRPDPFMSWSEEL